MAQAVPMHQMHLGQTGMAEAVPVAQPLQNRDGCGALRCIHSTLLIFGVINLIVGIICVLTANITGLVFGLLTGILGIVSGAMMSPCGCCSDPGSPGTVKTISILSMVNIVLHLAEMGFTAYYMAWVSTECGKYNGSCGSLGDAIIGVLAAIFAWYFTSFAICVGAAFTAWKESSRLSAAAPLNAV